jgi:NADPH-dependent curcumin reductase CurA
MRLREEELRFDAVIDHRAASFRQAAVYQLRLRGQHYADFLREVRVSVAAGGIRYGADIVDGLESAPAAFIGMLEGRNFVKLIVRAAA